MKKAFSLTRHCSANPSCHCEGGTTEAIQKKVRRSTGLPHSRWSLAMTSFKPAFSLVEMLMALLVASLLLAALAPVMTKRMNDSMTISIEGEIPGKTTKIHEIEYDSVDCPGGTKAKIDEDGSQYCEGEFTVPQGYNGQMKVTVIGAGGGGGVAPTAGYMEYTNAGSTNTFTVPALVNKLEATLISGGAGGGAGGQVETTKVFDTPGVGTWDNIPNVIKNKYVSILACAGGGGGGGAGRMVANGTPTTGSDAGQFGGGGGSGGFLKHPYGMLIGNQSSISYQVGGGGGGGGNGAGTNTSAVGSNPGLAGECGGGGDGGSDDAKPVVNNCSPKYGGSAGAMHDKWQSYSPFPAGGGYENGGSGKIINPAANTAYYDTHQEQAEGGAGSTGGNGGKSGLSANVPGSIYLPFASGGGGGKFGGGGGGGGCMGSGGGGGGPTYFNNTIIASGGGGGGGVGGSGDKATSWHCPGGGGGGGGGSGGGAGGIGGGVPRLIPTWSQACGLGGKGGRPNSVDGSIGEHNWFATSNKSIRDIYGDNHCRGGYGGGSNSAGTTRGNTGKSGIIKVTYLDYGAGGSGGGGGGIVPIQKLSVKSNDELKVEVGAGGVAGTPGSISVDSGGVATINLPKRNIGEAPYYANLLGKPSYIRDEDNNILLQTGRLDFSAAAGCATGDINANTNAYNNDCHWCGNRGAITDGVNMRYDSVSVTGFSNTHGHNSGDYDGKGTIMVGTSGFANGTSGGAGGITITPFTPECKGNTGGTFSSSLGKTATQGYGCGGGGGYGLSGSGAGSGGYARLSWNKYWDVALNSGKGGYKYADAGTAGGGASGNIATYTIDVKSGERIKFRIGKGGDGASVNNNTITNAKKGGDTLFAIGTNRTVKAGGGNGGGSPTITGTHPDTTISNGIGGSVNAIYTYKGQTIKTRCNSSSIISNCYIPSIQGNPGTSNKGGSGATLERNDKILRTNVNNSGGGGGTTGDNAKGANAVGYGSGGGGAGILDIGVPTISTHNPNTGGNGTNGKIILEWWE